MFYFYYSQLKSELYSYYIGQRIVKHFFNKEIMKLDDIFFKIPHMIINSKLQLKSINEICENDLILVGRLFGNKAPGITTKDFLLSEGKDVLNNLKPYPIELTNLLISKGYAVNLPNLSVETQIKEGFIDINNKPLTDFEEFQSYDRLSNKIFNKVFKNHEIKSQKDWVEKLNIIGDIKLILKNEKL